MAGKAVYKNDNCPRCGAPREGIISTGFYEGKEHEEQKEICQKCGKIY